MSACILACDTATHACSVALLRDGQVVEEHVVAPRQHTELILDFVNTVLAKAECTLSDVDAFAFGAGPGSFMGLRLAAAVMQGLAYTQKKSVIPVSTLQVLAQQAYDAFDFDAVVSAWDARMNEVYVGQYVLKDGLMQAEQPDALVKPEALGVPMGYFSVGNAWEVYLGQKPDADLYPRAGACAQLARAAFLKGEVLSPEQAIPNYVRDRVVHS